MKFTYAGGTTQQRAWVDDAVASCLYPLDLFDMNVIVTWNKTTPCGSDHVYMCTQERGIGTTKPSATITIETPADNPDAPLNGGLPAERAYAMLPPDTSEVDRKNARVDELHELKSFYEQSFVHEIGHVIAFALLTTDDLKGKMCQLFWRTEHRGGTARRFGTLGDYDGQPDWADRIKEAIAEVFKVTCFSGQLVYRNRANWNLDTDPATWQKYWDLMGLGGPPPGTNPGWQQPDESYFVFGDPVECRVTVTPQSEVGAQFGVPGYAGPPGSWAYDFDAAAAEPRSGIQITNRPNAWWPEWARNWFMHFTSAGGRTGDSDLGVPVDVFDIHLDGGYNVPPFSLDALHDPAQPGYAPHSFPGDTHTRPGLGQNGQGGYGSPPRSGFLAYRSMKFDWVLPPATQRQPTPQFVGWGMLEVTTKGFATEGAPQAFATIANPQTVGEVWEAVDDRGRPLTPGVSGGDANPPWPTARVAGKGPFFDGDPTSYYEGRLYSGTRQDMTTWTSRGAIGEDAELTSVMHMNIIRPQPTGLGTSPPVFPPAPSGEQTADYLIEYPTARIVFPDNSVPLSLVYPVAPGRVAESLVMTWLGPSEVVDPDWGFSLRVRFYPVKRVLGPPETNEPAGEAYAGQGPAGIIHHGKLPKSIGLRKGLLTP